MVKYGDAPVVWFNWFKGIYTEERERAEKNVLKNRKTILVVVLQLCTTLM